MAVAKKKNDANLSLKIIIAKLLSGECSMRLSFNLRRNVLTAVCVFLLSSLLAVGNTGANAVKAQSTGTVKSGYYSSTITQTTACAETNEFVNGVIMGQQESIPLSVSDDGQTVWLRSLILTKDVAGAYVTSYTPEKPDSFPKMENLNSVDYGKLTFKNADTLIFEAGVQYNSQEKLTAKCVPVVIRELKFQSTERPTGQPDAGPLKTGAWQTKVTKLSSQCDPLVLGKPFNADYDKFAVNAQGIPTINGYPMQNKSEGEYNLVFSNATFFRLGQSAKTAPGIESTFYDVSIKSDQSIVGSYRKELTVSGNKPITSCTATFDGKYFGESKSDAFVKSVLQRSQTTKDVPKNGLWTITLADETVEGKCKIAKGYTFTQSISVSADGLELSLYRENYNGRFILRRASNGYYISTGNNSVIDVKSPELLSITDVYHDLDPSCVFTQTSTATWQADNWPSK